MNKKIAFAATLGWLLAFFTIYQASGVISLSVFAQNGIPDEAFGWQGKVQDALVNTVLLFSAIFFCCSSVIFILANRFGRKRRT